jgi:hypothetical protein
MIYEGKAYSIEKSDYSEHDHKLADGNNAGSHPDIDKVSTLTYFVSDNIQCIIYETFLSTSAKGSYGTNI